MRCYPSRAACGGVEFLRTRGRVEQNLSLHSQLLCLLRKMAGDWKHRLKAHTLVWAVLLCGVIARLAAAESTYTVKRGDTLTGIARKSGVSVSTLAERNGLSKNHYVTVGQKLIIPGKTSGETKTEAKSPTTSNPPPSTTTTTLPKAVSDAIQNESVRAGRWKYIVIHHSAVDEGTMRGMDEFLAEG